MQNISKEEAISKFGPIVVENAISAYETDFGKTFFEEDADEYTSEICQEKLDYLCRAEVLGR